MTVQYSVHHRYQHKLLQTVQALSGPVWEYEDREWGAETNIYEAGRSQDIEGDYEEAIAKEILSWPDMLPGS